MPILVDFLEPSTVRRADVPRLTTDRVRKAAAIYLRIRLELMKFDGVTEDFAREHAEHARDSFIRQCHLGRIR